jgi:hypothetical protein
MKKIILLITIIITSIILTGCDTNNTETLAENIKKLNLTGNLVTYEAYYHNVVEYEKEADKNILQVLKKDKKLFIEYSGTIKLGIDLSKVNIELNGKNIDVTIPKATIIGNANVDNNDFTANKFIQSEDGILENKISADDSNKAFNKAQKEMVKAAKNDENLLAIAQKRAKLILEENINQLDSFSEKEYTINWIYE